MCPIWGLMWTNLEHYPCTRYRATPFLVDFSRPHNGNDTTPLSSLDHHMLSSGPRSWAGHRDIDLLPLEAVSSSSSSSFPVLSSSFAVLSFSPSSFSRFQLLLFKENDFGLETNILEELA